MPVFAVEMSVEPRSPADIEKLAIALHRLGRDDPRFEVHSDRETGQTIIATTDEDHLDAIVKRIVDEFAVNAVIGAPQIAYRETITKKAEISYTHKRETGGTGQFAKVTLVFEPLPAGSGFEFENEVVSDSVPRQYIPGVEKGIVSVKNTGILAGFPIVDFKATLTDGSYHDMDLSVLAFEIAARGAFREAKPQLGLVLLEPIMKVDVTTPEEFMGDVIGDINSRRGEVQGTDSRGDAQVVTALVPLANMFGYASTLHSMTQGRGTYGMDFSHYARVTPPDDDNFRPAIGMRA